MLAMSRKVFEGRNKIVINGPCVMTLLEIRSGGVVRLGFDAPLSTDIVRAEVPGAEIIEFQIRTAIQEERDALDSKAS